MKEKEIIQGCQKLDVAAQHFLFRIYSGRLMTICCRYAIDHHEAEDMLQEAFIQIFTHIRQFNHLGSFEGWLKKITVNASIRVLQQRKIRFVELDASRYEPVVPDIEVINAMNAEDLLKMIQTLPDGYRTIFNLFVMEGYSHEEISRLLGIKPATSRSQLSKARAMLQNQMAPLKKTAKMK